MYVGDRDTYNDVFCQDCGNIADKETLNTDGICEDCARRLDPLKSLLTPKPMNVNLVVKLYKSLDTEGKEKLLSCFNHEDRKILLSELQIRKVI